MSKSRRDLSLVAIAALVASSFAMSAPAQAAGELKIEPTSGSISAVPHQNVFALKVNVTPGNDSDELDNLKYALSTDGTFDVDADASGTVAVNTGFANRSAIDADGAANIQSSAVIDPTVNSSDVINVLNLGVHNDGKAFATDASTRTVSVIAFIDSDGDDEVDSDEWQVSEEVKFLDVDDIELTNSLTTPVLNDTTLKTTITSTNINLDQSELSVEFIDQGASEAVENSASTARTYSSTRGDLTFEISGVTGVTAGTYSSSVYAGSHTSGTGSADRLGNQSTRTVAAADVQQITGTAVRSEFNEAITVADPTVLIKSGSGSLTYVVHITKNTEEKGIDGDPVVGKTVSLKLEEDAIGSLGDGSVTVGDVVLKNDVSNRKDTATATATSNDEGKATFVISWSGLEEDDAFDFTASADGQPENTADLTAKDSKPSDIVSADVINKNEDLVKSTDSAFDLTYHVLDQFGALYSDTNATVVVNDAGGSGNTYTGRVSNGAATVSMPAYDKDNDGALSIKASVSVSRGTEAAGQFDHVVFVGAPKAPAAVAITGGTTEFGSSSAPLKLNSKATARADVRFAQYTTNSNEAIDGAGFAVKDANGNGTRSQVTLSGENLIFEVEADEASVTGEVYSPGSITVWTDENGDIDFVDISSQYAGKHVLTVTAGGVSETQDIYFGSVGEDAATDVDLDMPATVAAGSTFQVTGTVTDDFGNPVQITSDDYLAVSYVGPGLPVGTLPTKTDKNGQFKFGVLLGSNDTGTGTVTASYNQDGSGDVGDSDKDITESESINNGSGTFTGTYGDVTAWTVNQGDGTAKVYVKFPPVGEKLRILHQTGGSGSYTSIYADTTDSEDMDGLRQVAGVGTYVVRTIDLADGTNRIRVSLDGEDIEVNGKDRPARYNE